MSKIEVDTVEPQSGTSLTLGASGDTITIPAGATLANDGTVTGIPASAIDSGTIATARLGSGTASSSTFLRGDQTFASATPADNSITTAQLAYDPNPFRNRIINGAMVIDQRNAGASVASGAGGFNYTLDRWSVYAAVASKFTIQQNAGSVTPPTGFSNYLGCTSSSAYTVGASETFTVQQSIEGFNTSDLNWGSASAKTITISAWVYSSLTGTFGGALQNSAYSYSYPFTYSISVANTWTQISVTIAGPTAGTWIGATNGTGIRVIFSLGAGSTFSGTAGSWSANQYWSATGATSVVGTSGATFYITGVQLEAGTTASDFEFLPVDVNLERCFRYYYKEFPGSGKTFGASVYATSGTNAKVIGKFPVVLRDNPSGLEQSGTANNYAVRAYSERTCTAVPIYVSGTNKYAWICDTTVASGQTAGNGGDFLSPGANGYLAWSAEL